MLDHLDTLDDDAPPAPDAVMLTRVRGRARGLRRRNRLTAIGASVVVLAVAAGTVAVVRDRGRRIDVVQPSASTSLPTPPPTAARRAVGTLPNGLHVEMTLETPTVALGSNIRAKVEVRNDTGEGKTVGVGPIQCVLDVGPVLRDSTGHDVADGIHGGIGCYDIGRDVAPGGSVSIAVSLSTGSVPIPPDWTGARYELGLERISGMTPAWRLAPVPVDLVDPRLSARLELPATSFAAGDDVKGTIVFDNESGAPIEYTPGGNGENPWEVALGQNGAAFPVPMAQGPCATGHPTQLPVGTSRFPFRVQLHNSSCAEAPIPLLRTPKCDNGIPPLEPGSYQIVFQASGAFRYLEIAPVSISVHG